MLLDVGGLRVTAGGREVVHGASLTVARGEALGLVGESGSGKTLTCRAILGVLPGACAVASGSIDFDGVDLTTLDARGWRELRSTRVGAVFQDPASYLNPSLPVGRQLGEVLRVKGGLSRREARARVLELFAAVGLRRPEVVRRQIPSQLSGGMQQRVMIAIAIACDPDLLIADEPTSALDVKTQAEIVALLRSLRARFGLSLLFVSHDLAVVSELCDRIAVFRHGEIVETAPTAELLSAPQHAYTRSLLAAGAPGGLVHAVA
ncbi:ABC transporter ATP-binding protein [Solirubrobacter ginsenosidimutans]|uniref:ABC transporter ATP-binding protein n=1 Tax=Solirubrobacter ginsenosidimutans TaxID=490573 RepID=A0A9X3MTH9_9ACTN|nr:ABC transporter ATP-binding protein [Solirubrobacter ginsenosidimutans]MDA0159413.1 ABC transporter ATP-binding protein [Solirubrobacter ginsenosidimutans]